MEKFRQSNRDHEEEKAKMANGPMLMTCLWCGLYDLDIFPFLYPCSEDDTIP